MKHYITKYEENGVRFAEAWLQINFFGKCFGVILENGQVTGFEGRSA